MKNNIAKGLTIFMLIVALLSSSALAEPATGRYSIKQVLQESKNGWHETYEAHGRTIMIDIQIHVPEAEHFPAIVAQTMPLLENVTTKGEKSSILNNSEVWNSPGALRVDTPVSEVMNAARRTQKQAERPRGYNDYAVIHHFDTLETDLTYSFNNADTVADVQALLEKTWEGHYPAEPLSLVPHWLRAYQGSYLYNQATDTYSGEPWPDFQAPLMVYFNQVLNDIPLITTVADTYTHYAGTEKKEANHRLYLGAIGIAMGLKDVGIDTPYRSLQYLVLRETKTIANDVMLCSFEKVKETYEGLIMQGLLRNISSLRLGYVAWFNDDKAHSYTLMPTWVAEGELYADANAENTMPEKQYDTSPSAYGCVLVNAQTGEWINPWNTESNRSFTVPNLLK
jgi:hypothetical protein